MHENYSLYEAFMDMAQFMTAIYVVALAKCIDAHRPKPTHTPPVGGVVNTEPPAEKKGEYLTNEKPIYPF